MCGRYVRTTPPEDLAALFAAADATAGGAAADYNVAPTKPVVAVLERAHERPDEEAPDAPPARWVERRLAFVRWGLVPSWAKDLSIGSRLFNARAESVASKPAFRKALARRRCLLPANGYYEWQRLPGQPKQPWFIHLPEGVPLALGGLYEIWRDPAAGEDAPLVWSATVITTEAAPDVAEIPDRTPLVVPRGAWDRWLDPARTDPDDVADLLAPSGPGTLVAVPVGRLVNDVRNNGPELLAPPTSEQLPLG